MSDKEQKLPAGDGLTDEVLGRACAAYRQEFACVLNHKEALKAAKAELIAAPRQPGEMGAGVPGHEMTAQQYAACAEAASAQQDEPKLTKREAVEQVQGFCNRIPGSTQWNAAEFMYDLLTKGSIE